MKLKIVALAGGLSLVLAVAPAVAGEDLVREILRQQSAAERSICVAVKHTLESEPNAALVVRSAIELGYNACQVVRCAIEGGADLGQVIQAAAEAGVEPNVVVRCAIEGGADRAAVAALYASFSFEPNFCYFTFAPLVAPDAPPPTLPVEDREYPSQQPQASVFTF